MVQRQFFVFVFGFYCIGLEWEYIFARSLKTKKCDEAVGIQSGDVDDHDITVSSRRKDFDVLDAWCPSALDRKQYFQVNLGDKTKITKVSTQGRLGDLDRHVKSYRLYYSMDGHDWKVYQTDGVDKIFKGNKNSYDVMDHMLDPAIVAKYIRINPTSWKNDICLRVEYYGCDGKTLSSIQSYETKWPDANCQFVEKLHKAEKVDNWQQFRGVFVCVGVSPTWWRGNCLPQE